MARKVLTEAAIKRLNAAAKRQEVADGLIPGLYLQIEPSDTRSWVVRYRTGKRTRKLSVGRWPAVSLGSARSLARDTILAVKRGGDPGEERKRARQQATTMSLRAISEEYLAREGGKLRSAEFNRRSLERLVFPELGSYRIDAIKRSDINRLFDKIEDTSGAVMADRTFAVLRRVMNWHATRSDDFRPPIVRGMARTKPRERARDRVLSDDELHAIWATAETFEGPFGRLVQFILLTAARRSEAAGLCLGELLGADWVLPASRNKTKVELVRPLSASARAILDRVPRIGEGAFIFTTDGKHPISGFSKFKTAFDEASNVTAWTLHDLRRTARSLMSRAGVLPDHAERCLGHVIGGVRATYDRHEYYQEKKTAFEALASQIERLLIRHM